MSWSEDTAAARVAFYKAWALQVIAGAALTTAIWATVPYLWRVAAALDPLLLAILLLVTATALFTLRKLYRFVFGCTEFGIASMTVLSAAGSASHIVASNAPPDTQQTIELTVKLASAIYLFVKALDDMWDSGMLLQSLQVGILRPFLVRPQIPVETSDPTGPAVRAISTGEILHAILLYPLKLWASLVAGAVFWVIGNALWRCLAMLLVLGAIAEALILAFLHHLPPAIPTVTAIIGLVLFLLLMRWFGKGKILCGLWIALLSAGLMGSIVTALAMLLPTFGDGSRFWILLPAALFRLFLTFLRRADPGPPPPRESEPQSPGC